MSYHYANFCAETLPGNLKQTCIASFYVFVLYLVKLSTTSWCTVQHQIRKVQLSQYVNKPFILSKQSFEVSPIGVFSSHTGAQRQRHCSIASSMTFCSRPDQARSNQAPLQISNVEYSRLTGDTSDIALIL